MLNYCVGIFLRSKLYIYTFANNFLHHNIKSFIKFNAYEQVDSLFL